MIASALAHGACYCPEPGDNLVPNVHVDDLAEAYALALERAPARTALNVASTETPLRDIAEAIGRLVGRPAVPVPLTRARELNPVTAWVAASQRVEARRVRASLGWAPIRPRSRTRSCSAPIERWFRAFTAAIPHRGRESLKLDGLAAPS